MCQICTLNIFGLNNQAQIIVLLGSTEKPLLFSIVFL